MGEAVECKPAMERKGLLQSNELYQYLLNTSVYPREAKILKELREAADQHPMSIMGTSPDAGQLMEMLLSLTNAKKTIEVGVFTGYSLLLTALSLPEDGKITAIDIDRKPYEKIGLPFIRKAGVEHKINFVESPALAALDNMLDDPKNEGTFDFAFVDADKEGYKDYHERLMKLVKVGGVVAYDNTLWHGKVAITDESLIPEMWKLSTRAVIELNQDLASDSRIKLSHVPVGDGITICKRLA